MSVLVFHYLALGNTCLNIRKAVMFQYTAHQCLLEFPDKLYCCSGHLPC